MFCFVAGDTSADGVGDSTPSPCKRPRPEASRSAQIAGVVFQEAATRGSIAFGGRGDGGKNYGSTADDAAGASPTSDDAAGGSPTSDDAAGGSPTSDYSAHVEICSQEYMIADDAARTRPPEAEEVIDAPPANIVEHDDYALEEIKAAKVRLSIRRTILFRHNCIPLQDARLFDAVDDSP